MKNYQVDALRFSAAQNALRLLLDRTSYRKIELFQGNEASRWQYEFLYRLVERGILKRSGKPRHPMQQFFVENLEGLQNLLEDEEELRKALWPKAQLQEDHNEDTAANSLPLQNEQEDEDEDEEPENDPSGQLIAAFTVEIKKLHAVIETFDERLTRMDERISESSNKVDALRDSIEVLAIPTATQETSPTVTIVSTALNKITEIMVTTSNDLSKHTKWMEKRFDQEATNQAKERKALKDWIKEAQQHFYKMQHTNFDSLVKVMNELCEIVLENLNLTYGSSPINKIMITSITQPKKSDP